MNSDSPVNESRTTRLKLEQTVTVGKASPAEATPLWAILEEQLDRFFQAWDAAPPPPEINTFLASADITETMRRLLLIELIKVDLEFRWYDPQLAKPAADYFQEWPSLYEDSATVAELLHEEIYQRRQRGQTVHVNDYFDDFPASVEELKRLLGVGGDAPSTSDSEAALARVRSFSPGDRIDDFDLLSELGQGSFATVFLAVQRSMQRTVALKISRNSGTEAEVLAQLDHPNIVRVFDRRVLPEDDLQLFYMQHVRGGTLRGVLQSMRNMPADQWNGAGFLSAIDDDLEGRGEQSEFQHPIRDTVKTAKWSTVTCDIATQLCRALDYAHRNGVLHRDIKPGNILVTEFGTIKLADFNVSSCQALEGVIPQGYFGGSLAYMAPEQLDATNPERSVGTDAVDERSDLYAFAVLMWELLTGVRPFGDEEVRATWSETLDEMAGRRREGITATHWERLPPETPPALRSFFKRALQPEPSMRLPTARDAMLLLHLAKQQSEAEVQAETTWTSRLACRFPMTLLVLAAVIPNGMAGWFVYAYNQSASVAVNYFEQFFKAQFFINAFLFPIGAFLLLWLGTPIATAIHAARRGEVLRPEAMRTARRRSLGISQSVVVLGAVEWLAAGLLFPTVLTMMGVELDRTAWFNFIGSNVLGGLIAGTYPFFVLTFIALNAWYPAFLEHAADEQADLRTLEALERSATLLETLAGALPMLAVVLLVTWGKLEENQFALSVLGVTSLIGYIVVSWLSRHIRRRLQELRSTLTFAWSDKNPSAA